MNRGQNIVLKTCDLAQPFLSEYVGEKNYASLCCFLIDNIPVRPKPR